MISALTTVKILIRLLGFILLASVIINLPELVFQYSISNKFNLLNLLRYIAYANITTIFFGVILIIYASTITKSILFNDKDVEYEKIVLPAEDVLIRFLGLYLLFHSLSDIVFHITNYYMLKDGIQNFEITGYKYPLVIATLFEIAMSLVFVIKPSIFTFRKGVGDK